MSMIQGQDAVKKKLLTAIEKKRLPSSMLFLGPSGVGKQMMAWAVAQIFLCENPSSSQEACGQCGNCHRVALHQNENILFVEPRGTAIQVEQSRQMIEFFSSRLWGKARFIIINEAHRFNVQAANALLKVLEEPPPESYFILLAPTKAGVLPTIRSRTQVFPFGTLPKKTLQSLLQRTDWVIEAAHGRMDLAQTLLEKEEWRQVVFGALQELLKTTSPRKAYAALEENIRDSEFALFAAQVLQLFFRDVFLRKRVPGCSVIHKDQESLLQAFVQTFSIEDILTFFQQAINLEKAVHSHWDKGLFMDQWLHQIEDLRTHQREGV
ncbi:MAG: AAA family ATPase [Bdellovibrio sp.]|nr:MAG: AAA family ATPase [Bdellovibrio sp.]